MRFIELVAGEASRRKRFYAKLYGSLYGLDVSLEAMYPDVVRVARKHTR